MKFSGKVCLKIILKVTKKQGFSLSLEDTLFEKPQSEVKLIYSGAVCRLFPTLSCKQFKLEKPMTEKLKCKHLDGVFEMF